MSTVTIVSPAPTGERDRNLVELCHDAGVIRLTEPHLPDVKPLDFTRFENDNEKTLFKKWPVLEDAIRKLTYALHDQFRQNVHARNNDASAEMVIEQKGCGQFGEEVVFSLEENTNLYTIVFELVSNERLGKSSRALFQRYEDRCEFFAQHHVRANTESVADGSDLLEVLVATTKNFCTFLNIMNQIFMALDSSRTYSIHDTRPCIDQYGKQMFYGAVFDLNKSSLKLRIIDSLIDVYRGLRFQPQDCDTSTYSSVIVEVFDRMDNTYDIFGKDYQEHLIKDISNFYASLGSFWRTGALLDERYAQYFPSFAGSGSVDLAEYARLCERAFTIELDLQSRVQHRDSSKKKVEQELRNTLIHDAVGEGRIFSSTNFKAIFQQGDYEGDIKRLFSMFRDDSQALQIMSQALQEHIVREGRALIAKYEDEYAKIREHVINVMCKGVETEASKRMVDAKVKNRTQVLQDIVSKSKDDKQNIDSFFSKQFQMVQAQRDAYSQLAKETIDGNPQEELFAIYIDRIIKREKPEGDLYRTDEACESALSDISDYFHFLENKDLFMMNHRDLLSRRILSYNAKTNTHLEQYILQKLSAKEGVTYTNQAEKQINDCLERNDTNRKYSTWAASSFPEGKDLPELEVTVISYNAWPIDKNLGKFNSVKLPEPLEKLNNSFASYHNESKKKRVLNWINRCSLATVSFRTSEDSKSYRLIANAQQAAILCLFETYDTTLSLQQIQDLSGIVPKDGDEADTSHFNRVLRTLMGNKMKILIKEPDSDIYKVNDAFTSAARELKLPEVVVQHEVDKETIQQDRTYAVQWAIVKAMKLRKKMLYTDLVNEAMDQCKQFKPQIRTIKECLDDVIAKDWIRRSPNNVDELEYTA